MLEDVKSLPPLPASIGRIQVLCMMQDVNVTELTQVIEGDPMLSANILKAVNSPLYGMSKEVSSIRQAVMLFGVSMIRGFAAANAIKKTVPLDLTPYDTTIEKLTEISALQLSLARAWYTLVDKTMLPLLGNAAFLMELGKLIASRKIITSGEMEGFLHEVKSDRALSEVERCYLGVESYDVTAMMFEHWNFEPLLVDTLRAIAIPSEKENPYAPILKAISQAINIRGAFTPKGVEEALKTIQTFGLDSLAFEQAVDIVKSTMKQD